MAQPAVANTSSEEKAFNAAVEYASPSASSLSADGGLINASGHRQQLERNFGLMSVIAYAITAGNTWIALGGTIIVGAQTVSMYAAFHPEFVALQWHVFVSFLVITWLSCAIALFANRLLPLFESLGGFFTISGVIITVVVCAAMPTVKGTGHASNNFVWSDWVNTTGYSSDGFVFLLGMLNGAFAVGTPDITTHLAEEIPKPSVNIPKAILAQFVIGFTTTLFYIIAIFYGLNDLDTVLEQSNRYFPLAAIYRQTTGSGGGTLGLLILSFLPLFIACVGLYLTSSRTLWTLARDNATPFSGFFSQINPRYRNPANAILLCACLTTVLGIIYVGSKTAFSAFVGSFVVLTTLSYLTAILPHLLTRRANITPGWFWMKGAVGYVVNAISCLYIVVFIVIFCFPFALPVGAPTMNYTSLITGGLTLFVAAFYMWRRKDYAGPQQVRLEDNAMLAEDAI
ncbi:MAG: hypothetical protein LQ341_000766 [Variospora aurantia]|nr:MAG: hypothetical protein LQ341_000766 [Variospora aurantia]